MEQIKNEIEVREVTLPGVGVKYVMPLRAGGNVAVLLRPDGTRQIYHFLENEDRPCDLIKFDDDESQQLANLLGRPLVSAPAASELELALGGLEIEWVTLDEGSSVTGKTLKEMQFRTKTGASIIAVMRDDKAIPNPGADTVLNAGDTLLVIGSKEQCHQVRDLL